MGVGKALCVELAKIAEENGCELMDWAVHDVSSHASSIVYLPQTTERSLDVVEHVLASFL